MLKLIFAVSCLVLSGKAVSAQHQQQQEQYTTPIPILKQIDRHNDDGSYTYGYEAADKSYKIETKYPTGEVYGKYGYVDDQGQLREIEYGASKRGFEPAGSDINVPPPTLKNDKPYPLAPNEVDDGQYREDPSIYYKDEKFNRPIAASKFSLNNFQQPQQQQPQPQYYNPVQPQTQFNQPRPAPALPRLPYQQPQNNFYQQPQPYYQQPQQPTYTQQPAYPQQQQQQQQHQQQYNGYNLAIPNHFHPAVKSLDIFSGSYSLDYTGRR